MQIFRYLDLQELIWTLLTVIVALSVEALIFHKKEKRAKLTFFSQRKYLDLHCSS
jgi:hypothetical protein